MESHPVPQNVTSFEFHLVGDMTLKQFLYLASGLTLAYFTFLILFPVLPLIAVPLILIFASTGAAFAFLPISDRPLEHWLKAYFRAIFNPTQLVWKSASPNLKQINFDHPIFKNRLSNYLKILNPTLIATPYTPPPQSPAPTIVKAQTANISTTPSPATATTINVPQITLQTPSINVYKQPTPAPILTRITPAINTAPPMPSPQPAITPTPPHTENHPTPPQTQNIHQTTAKIVEESEELEHLIKLAKQNQQLQQKVTEMAKQLNLPPKPMLETKSSETVPLSTTSTTKAYKPQILLTSFPNVINGVVTDVNNNYLEDVIIIIHNKEGLPVRALKTNKLGQFTGATPLPDGVYTISLEKDTLDFDTLEITLKGEVLQPLKVMAKPGGVVQA